MNNHQLTIISNLADLVVQVERSRVLDVQINEPENNDFGREIQSLHDLTNKELQTFLRFSVEDLHARLPESARPQLEMFKDQWRAFYSQKPN